MNKTIVEKVFSQKSKKDVKANDIVMAKVDGIMTNDASGPLTFKVFEEMDFNSVFDRKKIVTIIDHYVPCPNDKVAKLHNSIYEFKGKYGIKVVDGGNGIGHQIFDEIGFVIPGNLLIGGDSHTTTYGYLNCIGIGMGSSDIAMAMGTGEIWFRVPETIKIRFEGKPKNNITGKDIGLYILKEINSKKSNYKAFEFEGDGLNYISISDRKTICNLMAEASVKCAIMPFDEIARKYCLDKGILNYNMVKSDEGCDYSEEYVIDLSKIDKMISIPHSPKNAVSISKMKETKIDMALIGTCTGGKIDDFKEAYMAIKDIKKNFECEVLLVPASKNVLMEMMTTGILIDFLKRGAILLPPSCGPCCGSSAGVPRDFQNVISTANRNFIGRMGNVNSNIYLASPDIVARSALYGIIKTT